MSNFKFLENINKDLYSIGVTAEKLFRDEYFDQCITQTRKMAEVMTKDVLGNKAQSDDTFDDMIYKLKTVSCNNLKEQEFISDMYFLKKQGNIATHSSKSSDNNGQTALECLEHAFEASINYASSKSKDEMIPLLLFDEQLLVLGKKSENLQTQYKNKLQEEKENKKQKKETKNSTKPQIKSTELKTKGKKQKSIKPILSSFIVLTLIVVSLIIIHNLVQKITTYTIQQPANLSPQQLSISKNFSLKN